MSSVLVWHLIHPLSSIQFTFAGSLKEFCLHGLTKILSGSLSILSDLLCLAKG